MLALVIFFGMIRTACKELKLNGRVSLQVNTLGWWFTLTTFSILSETHSQSSFHQAASNLVEGIEVSQKVRS